MACGTKHILGAALIAVCMAVQTGCAGPVTRWMVNLRTAQGDSALARPNLAEAEKEYRLALALDPRNAHAKAGLAKVLYLRARTEFGSSQLDAAAEDITQSLRYAPDDAAALALANEIEQAKIRREIVQTNYPLYGSITAALVPAFRQVAASSKEIQKQVKAFSNDFDAAHLTKAILQSYDLEDEVHRITLRLIAYRGYVTSGQAKGAAPAAANAPALLPIP